jgi:hypothetical protein
MKTTFKLTVILLIAATSCDRSDMDHAARTSPEQPVAMKVYCQSNPDALYQNIIYEYENGNLILESCYGWEGNLDSQTTYEYDANNRLQSERYDAYPQINEKKYVYDYTGRLIKILHTFTFYDAYTQTDSKTEAESTYEYSDNLLIRENEHWGGFNTRKYDREGRMIEKTDHTAIGQPHHITHYTYKGNLKVEEWKESAYDGSIIYRQTFHYDAANRLVKIIEDGKVVEENIYVGNRLTERRISYYGIDPGFYFCYGNFIYRYEY